MRETVYASSNKVEEVELPLVTGAQMIVSQAPDDGHGAITFSVCLLDLGLALVQSSLELYPILLQWNGDVYSVPLYIGTM